MLNNTQSNSNISRTDYASALPTFCNGIISNGKSGMAVREVAQAQHQIKQHKLCFYIIKFSSAKNKAIININPAGAMKLILSKY